MSGREVQSMRERERERERERVRERDPMAYPGIYLKKCKSFYNKGTCTPLFIATLFTVAKLWKHPRCPTTDEWINEMWFYIKWYFIQLQRRMKFCCLQENGWNYRK
jgi:hypothetical protein